MNTRYRFLETIRYGQPDRALLFPEGIRDEVFAAWKRQGWSRERILASPFLYDRFEELEPDIDPRPGFDGSPSGEAGPKDLRSRLDPLDPARLPTGWKERVRNWKDRQHVLFLRIHDGFFLTMGVGGWRTFTEACLLLVDRPDEVRARLALQAEFAARLAERILAEVELDGIIFSEPIADPHGPLVSPHMYAEFVLKSFEPIWKVLERFQVPAVIFRSYANPRRLLPALVESPINCLWACEANQADMDYRSIRAEYGPGMRLIGGIDADVLRLGEEAIRREVEEKVPPLLEQGGYIPLADGRVRADVPFASYAIYRRLLEEIVLHSGSER
jgi:hypothetical protein